MSFLRNEFMKIFEDIYDELFKVQGDSAALGFSQIFRDENFRSKENLAHKWKLLRMWF